MIAYGGADQGAPTGPEQPEELVEPLADTQPPAPTVAPSEPPPVIPPPSAPSPSAEIRAQHTAILRQIQHQLAVHQLLSMPFPPHQEPPTRHSGGTTSSLFFNRFYHIEDNV